MYVLSKILECSSNLVTAVAAACFVASIVSSCFVHECISSERCNPVKYFVCLLLNLLVLKLMRKIYKFSKIYMTLNALPQVVSFI